MITKSKMIIKMIMMTIIIMAMILIINVAQNRIIDKKETTN